MDLLSKIKELKETKKSRDQIKKKKVYYLPTGAIVPNPYQSRKSFGNISLSKLADSIEKYGIIEPIIIRPRDNVPFVEIGGEKIFAEKYEIVCGERRWRAAMMLELDEIPCILIDSDSKKSLEIHLAENIQRDSLHFLEETEGASTLIRDFGHKAAEAAEIISVTKQQLANRIKILQLSESERKAILKSGLSERHAVAISRVEDDTKRFSLMEQAISTSMSAPETESAAENMINPKYRTKGDEKRKLVKISDIGFFLNSLNRAVDVLESAGIKVDKSELESDGTLEIKIKITKKKEKKNA